MIFVDTNVFMYAVGGPHPLRKDAQEFFAGAVEAGRPLCTSAEVLQELLHAYLPVRRTETLRAALDLVRMAIREVWALEPDDVWLAANLPETWPGLSSRDLVHLASCKRREVTTIKSFDRAFASAIAPRKPAEDDASGR